MNAYLGRINTVLNYYGSMEEWECWAPSMVFYLVGFALVLGLNSLVGSVWLDRWVGTAET